MSQPTKMVRCQLLDMDSGDFYADAPSRTHSGKSAATLPIDHIDEDGCLQLHETPAASSGQQRFREDWESLLHEAQP